MIAMAMSRPMKTAILSEVVFNLFPFVVLALIALNLVQVLASVLGVVVAVCLEAVLTRRFVVVEVALVSSVRSALVYTFVLLLLALLSLVLAVGLLALLARLLLVTDVLLITRSGSLLVMKFHGRTPNP